MNKEFKKAEDDMYIIKEEIKYNGVIIENEIPIPDIEVGEVFINDYASGCLKDITGLVKLEMTYKNNLLCFESEVSGIKTEMQIEEIQ